MNVYFIDPTYVKQEAWQPLLQYLKVKAVYSFISKEALPEKLMSIINPYLCFSYSNQDIKEFSNNCAYWLRARFEKYIRLVINDYKDIKSIPKQVRKKYGLRSAYHNIINNDFENCLILLNLESKYNDYGCILPPECYIFDDLVCNLPTHIANYCLNILRKKYQHNQYQNHSCFLIFDKYFRASYRYIHENKENEWEYYFLKRKDGRSVNFIFEINRNINKIAPCDFPIINDNEQRRYTLLISEEGYFSYMKLKEKAKERAKIIAEEEEDYYEGTDWREEVEEMSREFWRECGEAASNCDSWPGWE